MKSLILTVLYLAKDTVNRWFTRISSPLARVLVVFFLSLCALFFLGSYVISAKIIRDRILREGGDLVHAIIFPENERSAALPSAAELDRLFNADSLALQSIGTARVAGRKSVPIFTFDFRRSGQMLPLMAADGRPTLVCPAGAGYRPGPLDVTPTGAEEVQTVAVKLLPPGHLLNKLLPSGGILVQPETAENLLGARGGVQQLILRVRDLRSAEDLTRIERYLETLIRLEQVHGNVTSASRLMKEMDIVLGNQTQCRAAFCLGIVVIVGILLTALAGMEYRQNEYIYTLMKSFGIHPSLLVLSFLAENLVLVGASFVAAVAVFMQIQGIVITQFFKQSGYALQLAEIMPEMELIAASLAVCVLVSSLPIMAAAHREIGRVLK